MATDGDKSPPVAGTDARHPSFLELDRMALGVETPAKVRDHAASCPRCREHLELLREEESVPARVKALCSRPPLPRLTFALAGAATLTLLVVVGFLWWPGGKPDTRVKGSPAVGVHIKRGDDVRLWDGRSPIRPGDRLRLEVVPGEFGYVSVYSEVEREGQPGKKLQRLFGGALAASGAQLLPAAWEVDETPGAESIIVVLSDGGTPQGPDCEGCWVRKIVFPKDMPEENPR